MATPAAAAGRDRGFLPPTAHPHGKTLTELAIAWTQWGFGSPADVNPLLANRCEQSPFDPKIWFLTVSLGGDYGVECHVPLGAFLVFTAGGYECSEAEGNGSTPAELLACATAGFATFTEVDVSLDGRAAGNLGRHIVTTPVFQLPGPNLFSADPSPSLIKGYFQVVHPLSPGQHILRASAVAEGIFSAAITYHLTVG
jgi:hypothetical protein